MDAEQTSRRYFRAIRGARSQAAFARRLGVTPQTVANWEAGRRWPSAVRAMWATERSGIDVEAAFTAFEPELPPAPTDRVRMTAWLEAVLGRVRINELADRLDCSRYRVSRWLSGRTELSFPMFLRIVEALTRRLSDLIASLISIDAIPELAAIHHKRMAARHLAFNLPWTEAVLRMLETEAYRALPRHRHGWVAARLGITEEQERRCLEALCNAGILSVRDGRYAPVRPFTVDTQASVERMAGLKAHWLGETIRRLPDPEPGDMFGYNVISVARADLDRIRTLHLRYFEELRSIVAESEPPETVALVGMQTMEFPAHPEPAGRSAAHRPRRDRG